MANKEKKNWTLVGASGKDLGGTFTGAPSVAAKKAASSDFANKPLKRGKNGDTSVYIRQTSLGNGHNQIKCYKVSQKMVTPGPNVPQWFLINGKVAEKKATEVTCPVRLRNLNN